MAVPIRFTSDLVDAVALRPPRNLARPDPSVGGRPVARLAAARPAAPSAAPGPAARLRLLLLPHRLRRPALGQGNGTVPHPPTDMHDAALGGIPDLVSSAPIEAPASESHSLTPSQPTVRMTNFCMLKRTRAYSQFKLKVTHPGPPPGCPEAPCGPFCPSPKCACQRASSEPC